MLLWEESNARREINIAAVLHSPICVRSKAMRKWSEMTGLREEVRGIAFKPFSGLSEGEQREGTVLFSDFFFFFSLKRGGGGGGGGGGAGGAKTRGAESGSNEASRNKTAHQLDSRRGGWMPRFPPHVFHFFHLPVCKKRPETKRTQKKKKKNTPSIKAAQLSH